MAYCKEVLGLIAYARGDFREAGELIQEAIDIFVKVGDRRNVASAKVNLARTAYRLGEPDRANNLINESLAFSRELNIRWNLSLGLEILGLLERSQNKDNAALLLFQESLKLSYEQDNLQGIANCLGAIAGIAAVSGEAVVSATLFAAAQKIRDEIMAGMGSGDQAEYDGYLALTHQQLTDEEFKTAQVHGISLTIEQAVELASRQSLSEESFAIRQFFSRTKTSANLKS
jgi:tetratricopeptide (TPR) repeat protein